MGNYVDPKRKGKKFSQVVDESGLTRVGEGLGGRGAKNNDIGYGAR
jgi:hypothetical protein